MSRLYTSITRSVASVLLLALLLELIAPVASYALTSGPTQPEFKGFEPVGTTGMVNEFTGGFTYNLPLLELPGPQGSSYPINIAYHSGGALEEDASWVGFGWTLNPGVINRNKRGIPDEYLDQPVTTYNKQPANQTWAVGIVGTLQPFSFDLLKYEVANRYNTFTGYSITSGVSFAVGNVLSLNIRSQNGVTRYSAVVNWSKIFTDFLTSSAALIGAEDVEVMKNDKTEIVTIPRQIGMLEQGVYAAVGSYLEQSFYTQQSPYVGSAFSGEDYYVKLSGTFDPTPFPGIIGVTGGISGQYTSRKTLNEVETVTECGYMNQHSVTGSTYMYDYSMEREGSWTSRDRYIYPGYQQYDVFSCTGQGISGGMRMYNKRPGMYGPRQKSGSSTTVNGGIEPTVGIAEFAIGGKITVGGGNTTTQNINSTFSAYSNAVVGTVTEHRPVMRFQNDLADNTLYSGTEGPSAFPLNSGLLSTNLNSPTDVYTDLNNQSDAHTRPVSSSSVTYRTNADLTRYDGTVSYHGFGKLKNEGYYLNRIENPTSTGVKRTGVMGRGLGEISVTNNAGVRYVYGLPVYARNEASLSYSGTGVARGGINDNRIVIGRFKPDNMEGVVGLHRKTPYAAAFMLTEVHTPDYIDRTKDGPTRDDFGGYTSFSYRRAAGTVTKCLKGTTTQQIDSSKLWYRWRTPYVGYAYNPGRLSLEYDDRATVSTGERELYYLSKIETKTHAAFFVTNKTRDTLTLTGGRTLIINGSQEDRFDAYEAYNTGDIFADEDVSGYYSDMNRLLPSLDNTWNPTFIGKRIGGRKRIFSDALSNEFRAKNRRTNKSEYLQKIILLAKSADNDTIYTDPTQTVNLEYNYETMQTYPSWWEEKKAWDSRLGRERTLTTREWDTIYGIAGTLNSALTLTQHAVNTKYLSTSVGTERKGKLTLKRIWTDYGNVKSPDIAPYEFQYRYRKMSAQAYGAGVTGDGVYDDVDDFDATFDKTGGSAYKADSSTDMVQNPSYDPLAVDPWGAYRRDGNEAGRRFREHLNQQKKSGTSDFDAAAWQLKIIRLPSGAQIHVHYEQNSYSWVQDQPALAMVNLTAFAMDGDKTVCTMDMAQLPGRDPDEIIKILKEYVRRERLYYKFLYPIIDCGYADSYSEINARTMEWITGYAVVDPNDITKVGSNIQIKLTGKPEPKELLKEFLFNQRMGIVNCPTEQSPMSSIISNFFGSDKAGSTFQSLLGAGGAITTALNNIASMVASPSYKPFVKNSFLRIPCQFKYGGGVRVKRIFVYDPNIEADRAAAYGNEFTYESKAGTGRVSHGVATNEPGSIREECALTRYLVGRDEQTVIETMASGEDLEQFEGPFMSAMYPGASIGYERVIITPLVSSPAGPGYTIMEFHTAKDYPVVSKASQIQTKTIGIPTIPIGPVSVSHTSIVASQGHSLVLNAMHGRTKSVQHCSGLYSWSSPRHNVVEETRTEYFKPGEEIPVLELVESAPKINSKLKGADRDVTMVAWDNSENHLAMSLEGDLGFQLLFQPYGHCTGISGSISDNSLRTGVISKVTTYSTFEKRTTIKRDGRTIIAENMAFDGTTGNPVIVRTYDEYDDNRISSGVIDGNQMQYTIPAWTKYAAMGQQSTNVGMKVTTGLSWTFPTSSTINVTGLPTTFREKLIPGDLIAAYTSTAADSANAKYYYVTSVTASPSAFNGTRAYLIGGTGGASFGASTKVIEVVRSGRSNQLLASAGQVTTSGHTLSTSSPWDFNSNGSGNPFVTSATMTTWSDTWSYPAVIYGSLYDAYHTNAWDKGESGKWRPVGTWNWRSTTLDIASYAAYRSGRANQSYVTFDHATPSNNDTAYWIHSNRVKAYTPNGEVAMEENALGHPSSAQFSHNGLMPAIIAKNGETGAIAYRSFEDQSSGTSTTRAHTGKTSLTLTTSPTVVCSVSVNTYLDDAGLMFRYWAWNGTSGSPVVKIAGTSLPASTLIANVNGWSLYETAVPAGHSSISTDGDKAVTVQWNSGGPSYLDDFKMQPLNSQVTCYAYDAATLRLIAQFDDEQFAAIYIYDTEGRLARKERETERGIFPIQERHYNGPSFSYSSRNQTLVGVATQFEGSLVPLDPGASGILDRMSGAPLSPTKANMKGEVLDVRISPQRGKIRLFDSDSIRLPLGKDAGTPANPSDKKADPNMKGGQR